MWRKKVDKSLKPYLERFIAESYKHVKNFELDDSGKAQLWVALSILAKQVYDLQLKLNYMEKALKDISQARGIKPSEEKEGEKFIQKMEQELREIQRKPIKVFSPVSQINEVRQVRNFDNVPVINLGSLEEENKRQEDKLRRETEALEEGEKLIAEITGKKPEYMKSIKHIKPKKIVKKTKTRKKR